MHVSECKCTGPGGDCKVDFGNSEASFTPNTIATALRLMDFGLDKIAPISRIYSRLAVA